MQYDNTNTGVLFINDKGDNPKRPDRKGSINIEGVDYWLSGWVREKDGKPYMQLKAERKEVQQSGNARNPVSARDEREMPEGEEIPF